MTSDPVVRSFAEHHSFDPSQLPDEQLVAIKCAVTCHDAVAHGFAKLPNSVLEQDTAVGLMWQLYERCSERVRGALVAFATSSPAASEILARATIESCATFRYILRDRHARLASFFSNHIEQAERQEKLWRSAAEKLHGEDRLVHLAACDYRRQGISGMNLLVGKINSQLVGSAAIPAWPTIASRFEDIGEEIKYRTLYARLCVEPHFDAEETLRYVFGQLSGTEALHAMAAETIAFSRLMLVEAVSVYAKAGRSYATAYEMKHAADTCGSAQTLLSGYSIRLASEIGGQAGAG